jgi:uncharacterized protein YgbK (DUF1537 family)
MTGLKEGGRRYAVVDALTDAHLLAIGAAAAGHALVTGGSGVAMGLPANFRRDGSLPERGDSASALPPMEGHAAVLAGLLLARHARADRAGAGPRADLGAGRARHARTRRR